MKQNIKLSDIPTLNFKRKLGINLSKILMLLSRFFIQFFNQFAVIQLEDSEGKAR